uniref:AlNc14C99G5979 protein n=1 Tax=Albugo laibachii Nc14 TaxID=890382 RepID=F0WHB3_9STRA|nr:AlNc14C99G5979 [Albugo laibachii Nc14]|eukprot:CCA20629.1 AlNc14C99G5979 [Albugo laibachii Nc14]
MARVARAGHGLTLGNDSEKTFVTWINLLRKDGVPLSSGMLKQKSTSVAKSIKLQEGSFRRHRAGRKDFMLQSTGIADKNATRTKTSSETDETVRAFAMKVPELMVTHGIEKVHNADQTGVFFAYVSKMTVNDKRQNTLWVRSGGKDKERLSAMFFGNNEGTKYPPFIVVHTSKSKRVERAVERQPATRVRESNVEGGQACTRRNGSTSIWYQNVMVELAIVTRVSKLPLRLSRRE